MCKQNENKVKIDRSFLIEKIDIKAIILFILIIQKNKMDIKYVIQIRENKWKKMKKIEKKMLLSTFN